MVGRKGAYKVATSLVVLCEDSNWEPPNICRETAFLTFPSA